MNGNLYSRFVGPSLREKLEQLATASPAERHSLRHEVDLQRTFAMEALRLSGIALESDNIAEKEKLRAIAVARATLDDVAKIVEKAAKVAALSDKTIDLEYLDYVTVQFSRIVERHLMPLPEGKELVDAIVEDIKAIKLPERQHTEEDAQAKADALRKMIALMDQSV